MCSCLNSCALQSATSALRRRVLGAKGQKPAGPRRLTHELSDISNTTTARAAGDQAGDQEVTDDPLAIVALLSVAGEMLS